MNQEDIAKRDAEFFKAWQKDKTINRADFNNARPIKTVREPKGFKNAPREFDTANPPSPEHKKIYTKLSEYCKKFPALKIPNIVLSGATGTGKTFITHVIANNLFDRGHHVEYTTAFNMVKSFQTYIQSFGRDDGQLNAFLECDLLIIDDLGAEPTIKNITLEHIYNIVNERLVNERPFIITTNMEPNALIQKYDQRIASRILSKETSTVISVNGKDLRIG